MLSDAVAPLVDGYDNVRVELVESLDEALARSEDVRARASRAARRRSRARCSAASAMPARSSSAAPPSSATTRPARRMCLPTGGLARSSGGLGIESFLKPLQIVRATPQDAAAAAGDRPARARGGAAARTQPQSNGRCRRGSRDGAGRSERSRTIAGTAADPVPDGFAPYAWAATVADVAARHGLRPGAVLKFDQNTPPLPGVPQVPLAESFARLERLPGRALPRAARGGGRATSARTSAGSRSWSVPGPTISSCSARATFLGPGRRAAILEPDVCAVSHRHAPDAAPSAGSRRRARA